jgi:hypothetical protein
MGLHTSALHPAPPRLLKHTLRSTFAALLAALALACAGLGARGSDAAGTERAHAPVLRHGRGIAVDVQRTLELVFLRGGGPVLAGRASRPGALPRVAPGSQQSGILPFVTIHGARGSSAGALIHPTLRPPFARRLAAARDGTLSARSTGVPPPAVA